MTDADVKPFEVCGPLPRGVTVLEASAGTGKTFTMAALAGRYVAEGMPLERMLMVTFTRMATGELRSRVRARLVAAEEGLFRAMRQRTGSTGGLPPRATTDDIDDEVLRLLATGAAEEVAARHARLAQALTDFDAATITTTHGFCEQVLGGLGIAGGAERDVSFVDDISDMVEEVVDDFYVRKFHRGDGKPAFNRAEALKIAYTVVNNHSAPIEPVAARPGSIPDLRGRFGKAVRGEVERRKRAAGVLTFDDLLTRLRDTLADEVRGPAACAVLRHRYSVALVDEFQDTDPVQWEIMRRAFTGETCTLVLIGDPKQAIYSFRGADVYAYLDAKRHATHVATLDVNWRSDRGLLDAYDILFASANLGHRDIPYRPIGAVAAHDQPGLKGAPVAAPLRVRIVHREDGHVDLTNSGFVRPVSGRHHVAADLAADIVGLLSSPAKLVSHDAQGKTTEREPLRPGHIAVLVRTNAHAVEVRDALDALGVPAVINGAGSVFSTAAAREWLRLLEALERPATRSRAASAAMTCFVGWDAARLAAASEEEWEDLHARLHRWAALLRRRGVASLVEEMTATEDVPARVLAVAGGERRLTDVRHAGQLLHTAATEEQLGVSALTGWLRLRISGAARDLGDEQRSRRLESDAEAVQVLTIHRSKGLEFPIIYFPFLWDPVWLSDKDLPVFHDAAQGNRRTVDIGGPMNRDHTRHQERFFEEERAEELRLAYVALTRAKHQAVIWWAGSWDARDSALSRLLFARDIEGNIAAQGIAVSDADAEARFAAMAATVPGRISVERAGHDLASPWVSSPAVTTELEAATFDRPIDVEWRRTSYSGITAAAHDSPVTSEPEIEGLRDEPAEADPIASRPIASGRDGGETDKAERALFQPVPLSPMPGGAEFGTFVHRVFERVDFAAPDLTGDLANRVSEQQVAEPVRVGEERSLVEGLRAAIETPLGPLASDVRLRDVSRRDRIDEMWFELPLLGGDDPSAGASLRVADIGARLREHLASDDAFSAYPDHLDDPGLDSTLRGFLAGSLDVVLRLQDGEQNGEISPRFAVVDYKTNRLAAPTEELTAWHYRPEAMVEEMCRAHYPLQALLYSVALHRYLRWRVRDYDPARNLAGVFYLFVRGMVGAATPTIGDRRCGVVAWQPPPDLIVALSDLFDRGRTAPA